MPYPLDSPPDTMLIRGEGVGFGHHVEPVDPRLAGGGEQRGEDFDERGLAGAVRAEQAEQFAGPHFEVHAVEGGELGGLSGRLGPAFLRAAVGGGEGGSADGGGVDQGHCRCSGGATPEVAGWLASPYLNNPDGRGAGRFHTFRRLRPRAGCGLPSPRLSPTPGSPRAAEFGRPRIHSPCVAPLSPAPETVREVAILPALPIGLMEPVAIAFPPRRSSPGSRSDSSPIEIRSLEKGGFVVALIIVLPGWFTIPNAKAGIGRGHRHAGDAGGRRPRAGRGATPTSAGSSPSSAC